MTARPWTGAELRDALRWHAEGMRLVDIASALDRTSAAVHAQLWLRGVLRKREPRPQDAAAAVAALRAECAAARAERVTSPPYRNGPLQW
jgi:hypothetical protein